MRTLKSKILWKFSLTNHMLDEVEFEKFYSRFWFLIKVQMPTSST